MKLKIKGKFHTPKHVTTDDLFIYMRSVSLMQQIIETLEKIDHAHLEERMLLFRSIRRSINVFLGDNIDRRTDEK